MNVIRINCAECMYVWFVVVLQNVAVTYAGMLFGDYIFDAYNFVGINVR